MRKTWVAVLGLLAVGMFSPLAWGADHRDGTAVQADATTDINDVFSWMSTDASKVYLVMTLAKNATTATKFSNAALYVFHTRSRTAFLTAPGGKHDIVCSFDTTQKISCWVTDAAGATVDFVTGDASATAGLVSTSTKVKVFAGLRNDPFFFNLAGFQAVEGAVKGAVKGGTVTMFDVAGCPTIDTATSGALVNLLKSNGAGGAPVDNFTKDGNNSGNVLAIVIAIDKTLLVTSTEKVLSVWGATTKIGQ